MTSYKCILLHLDAEYFHLSDSEWSYKIESGIKSITSLTGLHDMYIVWSEGNLLISRGRMNNSRSNPFSSTEDIWLGKLIENLILMRYR